MLKLGSLAVVASAVVLLTATVAAPAAAGAGKAKRWVDDDGKAGPTSCNGSRSVTKKIQTAINNSDRNDEIVVCPGRYKGTIRINGNRDGLIVRGVGSWAAEVVAPKPASSGSHLVLVSGVSDVTVKNLRVSLATTGTCGRWGSAIRGVGADGLRVLSNRIAAVGSKTWGACGYSDAVTVKDSPNVQIKGNVISDFRASGIVVEASASSIGSNSIRFLHAKYEAKQGSTGIRVKGAPTTLSGNEVRTRGTSWGGHPWLRVGIAVSGDGAAGSVIDHNRVSGAKFPLEVTTIQSRVEGNRVKQNTVGVHLHGGDNDVIGNDFRGNHIDDCWDWTTGTGTAGTANEWTGNKGNAQSPEGICQRDPA